jgi:FtsP/CotA-like multicopper oxidase with cupredoxin domain
VVVSRRGSAVGLAMLAVAIGVAVVPQQSQAAPLGVVFGHVPTAAAPTSATIEINKGAATRGYSTKVVDISQGGDLYVINNDSIQHTVTSDANDPSTGQPYFNVLVQPNSTAAIAAASNLAPGTYGFHCQFHAAMTGKLVVESGDGGGGQPPPQDYEQPLDPPKVLTGSHVHLTATPTAVQVLPNGPKTTMWTFDGSYPGPTIERPAGHDTKVTVTNQLPSQAGPITLHLHGDHHASADDGQPASHLVQPGASRTYNYPLTEQGKPELAAFDYYHDHRMGFTGRNNWNGLQGMFITSSPQERKLDLPTGQYDVPLAVSDRSFTSDNQLTEPFSTSPPPMAMTGPDAPPNDHTVGNDVLVDGRYAPYFDVAAHRYRLRLLNSSNFSSYDFQLSNGQPFIQIGSGDSLFPKAVVRQSILLGPSQRADVIVDFHGDLNQQIDLQSVPPQKNAPVGVGVQSASIMQFRVNRSAPDSSRLPSTLLPTPPLHAPNKVSAVWTFGLGGNASTGTYWTVNGQPFDPHLVDLKVPLGATQTWALRNDSPITHYIHIHEEDWYEVSRDGKPPPAYERGVQDTWRLDPGETVKVAAKFTDYTGVFMIHCHMLDHEDHGMMAQYDVVKSGGKVARNIVNTNSAAVGHARRHGHRSGSMAGMDMSGTSMSTTGMEAMPGMVAKPGMVANAATGRSSVGWSERLWRGGLVLLVEIGVLVAVVGLRRRRPGVTWVTAG